MPRHPCSPCCFCAEWWRGMSVTKARRPKMLLVFLYAHVYLWKPELNISDLPQSLSTLFCLVCSVTMRYICVSIWMYGPLHVWVRAKGSHWMSSVTIHLIPLRESLTEMESSFWLDWLHNELLWSTYSFCPLMPGPQVHTQPSWLFFF